MQILGQFPRKIELTTIVPLKPVSLDRTKVPKKGWIGPNGVKIPIALDKTSTNILDNGVSLERISIVNSSRINL